MSIFRKQDTPEPRLRERPLVASRGPQGEGTISIIGAGMKVVGDLSTDGTVRIEGEVGGTIRAGRSVVLGQGGVVEGDIFTDDAIIGGRVEGSIVATSRLELQATSVVTGEIQTRSEHLKLDEGARFEGRVRMLDGDAPVPLKATETPGGRRTAGVEAPSAAATRPAIGATAAANPGPVNGDGNGTGDGEGVVFELLDDDQRQQTDSPLLL